jgi:NAD(P)-dependent dehydrogenase (short-subunit alcohol dehydrogenase family)
MPQRTRLINVIVVIGPGSIGQAIARRVGVGKRVLLADLRQKNAEAAAEVLSNAGYEANIATVDVSSRESVHALVGKATALGNVTGVVHAAGVSPSQASSEAILAVDLYGTALVLEEFGNVIASGGSGVVIASQSGHRLGALTAEQNKALALTPADELLSLPFLQPDQVKDSLHAYQLSKRGNSLRVMAEAVRWGKRGARVNTISPGIVITPLARDELTGPRGEGYRRMIELCPVGRAGTPDFIEKWVKWGAGLRASQALVRGAKARALMHDRYHVAVKDIQALAKPILRHRILTNFYAESERVTSDSIVERLLETVPVPKSGM